ncbi:uncharacterized protein N7459_003031 [Penicillium hispanicum]|uniref:uncharacterized protein n=1 Tax=Penicillium hispanicum TaxID=1080232 RepID=UPI00253FB003|nr:uncharacterized protein N7459_003031 [Penicillium hispanicum]KAJ5587266.1 hypothetical protein N7459_003031 [Penicillium hispanicum]
MAIWPFGRKNKRHTIQVSAAEATALQQSLDQEPPAVVPEPTLARKPSRRPSKRQNNGYLSRNGDGSGSIRGSARASMHRPISSLDQRTSEAEPDRADPDQPPQRPLSRTGSLLRRQNQNGPKKLRRKLSKRKAHEIMREREIKMLSSTPIDIPRRQAPMGSDYVLEHRRRRANGRRMDRYNSDISLSIRDSAASSMSDISDPYTYKVNAFAALTPRPVVRYVEAPRLPTSRSNNPPAPGRSADKDRLQALTMSEEDLYYSRRRVNELADSLDAGALRELLDRDRRRREKKQVDDQEKLQRKLQQQADAQQAEEAQPAVDIPEEVQPSVVVAETHEDAVVQKEEATHNPVEEPQDKSKNAAAAGRDSLESVPATRNVDDGSMRGPKLAPRPSFAPSHDTGISRTTLSPSQSSLRQGISSASHSQTFGIGSTSDLSQRRPSDTSGRRGNTISSLFRRGSSRLKRRYRERFQESSPDVSNASHESFYKIQTQSSPPPPVVIPPRAFVPTGTVKRSHSKFTEHFGEEPMSPPDSRLQSPDIPEQVPESSLENDQDTFIHDPVPTAGMDIVNPRRRHHQSWTGSFDAESDNVPLSQSLASIDSEGSWMSGQFFRRMSQKPSSPARTNMRSFGADSLDGPADTLDEARDSIDSRGASSNVMGEPEMEMDATAADANKPAEMWHHSEVGRRPIVVNPVARPKSTQGMLRSIPSLSPISAEEDQSPPEEPTRPPAPARVASVYGVIETVE